MVVEFVIAVVVVGIFYYFFEKNRQFRSKIKWVPHKSGLPILGCALDFSGGTTKFLSVLQDYTKAIGNLYTFDIASRTFLVITDYKFMEYLLSSTKLITKSDDYVMLERWLGTGLLLSGGKKWKQRRRIVTPAFHFSILEQFIDIFETNGSILVQKLEKDVGKDSVDVYRYITLCALDDICESAMGTSINAQDNKNTEYVSSVKEMCQIFIMRSFSPIKMFDMLYYMTPDYYREKKLISIMHKQTNDVIDKRIKKLKSESESKATQEDDTGIKKKMVFLDILLKSQIDGQPLSKADIREEVDTFMFEGHDTTSSGMSFALYCLSKHPDVQEKIIQEQKEIFGDNQNPTVAYKDLQEMKYLEAVIKESLRLYPSVPFYGRRMEEDVEYEDGKILPKGLSLIVFAYQMHRDPTYFPNPEKFDPSRFEDFDKRNPYAYIPFSAGARNCIGQKFAMLMMKSTMSKILRNFKLLQSIPEHNVIISAETVLKSANGMKMKFEKRVY